jgi:hypothetical protein
MPDQPDNKFDQWAIVELMGHQRMAGRVQETQVAGAGFLRIDVPGPNGGTQITRFVSPQAVYAINPVDEAIARALATQIATVPIQAYEVPELRAKIRNEIMEQHRLEPKGRDAQDQDDEEFLDAQETL